MKPLKPILIAVFCCLLSATACRAAVLVKDKMWPQNSVIRVLFLDGNDAFKQTVRAIAPQWLQGTNLRFEFYMDQATAPANTQIRVSFLSHSGSILGDQGDFKSREATMVLSDLNQFPLQSKSARRLILHEFGHALGLEHEFLSPNWHGSRQPLDTIINHCQKQMQQALDLSNEEAKTKCVQLNQQLDPNNVLTTVYDDLSIMNYPLIRNKNGKPVFEPAATTLSVLDHYAIQKWYRLKASQSE